MRQNKIVLFMKGEKNAPRCQFSRQMVALLKEQNVDDYTTFDILSDQSVRQGEFMHLCKSHYLTDYKIYVILTCRFKKAE